MKYALLEGNYYNSPYIETHTLQKNAALEFINDKFYFRDL
jgi:hypothetical protein